MNITPNLREELKKPLGDLVTTTEGAKDFGLIICVGDVASQTLIEDGYEPKIIVYDGLTMRKPVEIAKSITDFEGFFQSVKNPQGSITQNAIDAVTDALAREGQTKIFVEGEEDLITLPAISQAPNGSLVIYGQPNEGLVFVEVDDKIKNKIKNMMEEMSNGNSNN